MYPRDESRATNSCRATSVPRPGRLRFTGRLCIRTARMLDRGRVMSPSADENEGRGPPAFPATSLSLLARARTREAAAWERLVDLYAPLVYHWCRRCGLSAEDSADVFQEVF